MDDLIWTLRSPKIYLVAVLASLLALLVHGTRRWPDTMALYFLAPIVIKTWMPMSFSRSSDQYVYVVYGLVVGAFCGGVVARREAKRDRLIGLGKGAAYGAVLNLAIAIVMFS